MPASASYFIDRAAAQAAVQYSLPTITAAMKDRQVGESGFLYVVVMDPGRPPQLASFEEAILYEHAIGDRERWDADYAAFARAKAQVAWKTGMNSHAVQELYPHLLGSGDTLLWGSVAVDGIVVGVSGAHPWFDEAIAGTIAMWLRALAKARAHAARRDSLFLPAEKP
jgi:hypothetical protein